MVWIPRRRGWELPEREVTPEGAGPSRRAFLATMGGAAAWLAGCSSGPSNPPEGGPRLDPNPPGGKALYPAPRNPDFADVGRALTSERVAASSNKFYEFSQDKALVWRKINDFQTRPWSVEVAGLCHRPRVFDLDDLARVAPLEERVYRHRCVEGWAKTIPWTGFPLRRLLEQVEPAEDALYVRFETFYDPDQAMQQHNPKFSWPYVEGLALREAMHELTLLATGVYGHALQKQLGAPVRLVVPWKYATKSIKSIVRIELTAEQPESFWNALSPLEVSWFANVDPAVPHPRWNQTGEWLLGASKMADTQKYNGYGQWVAGLYES
jgi:methionine sulfoxide reductase catalytic subunit